MDGFVWIVAGAGLVTSTISAVFGMAGGMILMGIYAAALPVQAAMILHGVSQLFANGFRAYLLRRHIFAAGLAWYALGAAASLAVFTLLAIVVERPVVFLLLGGIPLALSALPRRLAPRFDAPLAATCCGALVTVANLLAGVSGPLLDVFFVRAELDRFAVIATKAFTQTASHAIKILYFGALVQGSTDGLELPVWIYPLLVACAFVGTRLGGRILESMGEAGFRRWTSRIVNTLALIYVYRGASELGLVPW
jgi:uncharacterized membrane protein YfcA